ncbi:MAG: hypothetical protein WC319_06520 [Candidatus Paceibacterota bacterium]|jgi:hypothetical protein
MKLESIIFSLGGEKMLNYNVNKKRVPCVYEISYKKCKEGNPPCIVLRIHEEFVEANKDLVPFDFFIKKLQDDHNLGEFSSLTSDFFGFDNAIKRKEKDSDGFIVYEIEIPKFRIETSELCERCGGTGWDENLDDKCLLCRGSKYKISFNWKPLSAISASLHILSVMMETFNEQTSVKNNQLLTFQLSCGKGMGRFPIWGHYGIDFCSWLNSFGTSYHQFDEVLKEMEDVYLYIYNGEEGWGFQAYVEEKAWLIISTPGDACGIHPVNDYNWELGRGRDFSCHNMDNPGQQIIILVALAVLSDMARKHIKG